MWKKKQNEKMSPNEIQERRIQNLESYMETNTALNKQLAESLQKLTITQAQQNKKIEELSNFLNQSKKSGKRKYTKQVNTDNNDNRPNEVKNWTVGKEVPEGYIVVHRGKKPFLRKLQSRHLNYQDQFKLNENRINYLATAKNIKLQKISYDEFSKTIVNLLCKNEYEQAQNFAKNTILTPLTKSKDLADSNNTRLIKNKAKKLPKDKEVALLKILKFIKDKRLSYSNGNYCIVYWFEVQAMQTYDIDDEIGFVHCSSTYLPFNFTERQAKLLLANLKREFEILLQ